jgi:hypothetical protein
MPSDDAISARSPKGVWLVAQTVRRPAASGTTRIASGSIGTGASRWFTKRPWIVTSAPARTSSLPRGGKWLATLEP